MSLVVGTNSYASVAEADAYLSDRIGSSAWFALPESSVTPGAETKEAYLVSAYNWLIGSPILDVPATGDDPNLKAGQIESALYLLENYDTMKIRRAIQAQGVSAYTLSKKSETFKDNGKGSEIPDYILGILKSYRTLGSFVLLEGDYDV